MLPTELLEAINNLYPCRLVQLKQLGALIGGEALPSPQSIVIHGLEATGKTLILRSLLERSGISYSWLPCHECITVRQLTERIAATVADALEDADLPRCENVNALSVYLQRVLKQAQRKHLLVLDRADQLKDAPATLLASFRRMGELVPNFTVIFVVSVSPSRAFSSAELPHVRFPPYTKEESIEIVSRNPLAIERINHEDQDEDEPEERTESEAKAHLWLWQKFCATIWDSLAKGAARNVVQFRAAVEKNWAPFVHPVAIGEQSARNYSSLYLRNKEMFRREDTVTDSVLSSTFTNRVITVKTHDLPYYSKYLLCASYLASYHPPRLDAQLFMKGSELKRKRRRGGNTGKRHARTRKISRRLLGPQAFPVERLLAIFHAIIPHDISSSVDILAQIATLTSLQLLVKASALDPLDGSAKWKVNVGWDYIRGIARSIKFEIEDRMTD